MIVLSLTAGVVWGIVGGILNIAITKIAIKKKSPNAVMISSLLRTVVDVAALAAVFFTRELLPLDFRFTLIGTAVSMSISTIVMSFAAVKKM